VIEFSLKSVPNFYIIIRKNSLGRFFVALEQTGEAYKFVLRDEKENSTKSSGKLNRG
jgi:hypothetical protein